MFNSITIHQEKEWKQIVQKSLNYDFYHTWDYHNMSSEGNPILFVYNEGDDFIAFPLIKRNIPNSLFFDMTCVYGYTGPISNRKFETISDEMSENFKRDLLQFLKDHKIVSVFSRLHPFFDQLSLMKNFDGVYGNGKVVLIDLLQTVENQRSRYKGRLFGKIVKLKKQGFYIKESKSPEAIKEFTAIYTENMNRVGANSSYMFNEEYFQNFLNSEEIQSKLIMVYHDNLAVCGAIVIFTKIIIQTHLLATRTSYMKFSPAKLITDEITLIGRKLGMHYLNLGGGYGFKQDSLFEFKELFSDLSLDYKSWRHIADEATYRKLILEANIDPDVDVDFFPLYRYKNCSFPSACTTDNVHPLVSEQILQKDIEASSGSF